jgi:hypothetical protein
VLVLPSAEEEHIPKSINMRELMERWSGFCQPGIMSDLSALVPGANHSIDDTEAQQWFCRCVASFLATLG